MYAKRPKPEEKSTDLAGNRGTAYFFNRQYDLALKDYLDAVSTAPEDGNWRVNLGDVYAHLGQRDDALVHYRKAQEYFRRDVAADPEDVVARSRYARALAKSGDDARAREEIRRCLAMNPWRNAEALHDLAMALALCDQRGQALGVLDSLLSASGYPKCVIAAEDEFAGLHGDPRFQRLVGGTKP
jgi:tetratricopeptide (TPR) repeat protein